MNIALVQFNPTVGALRSNAESLLAETQRAHSQGATLAIAPELALLGYPPRDLLERPSFIASVASNERWLSEQLPPGIRLLFGSVAPNSGGQLTNDGVLIERGRELARVSKQLLPTYDVFDERRHFTPGGQSQPIELDGRRLLITICEDAWSESEALTGRYRRNPLEALTQGRCDALINISASPFTLDKWRSRPELFQKIARRHALPVVFVNQVGGNDQLIFDGRSCVFEPSGGLSAAGAAFEPALSFWDPGQSPAAQEQPSWASWQDPEIVYRALVTGVRDYVHKCGFQRAVLGLSGGIDSALTAAIAADALGPQNVVGVAMPSRYSSEGSLSDAQAQAQLLGVKLSVVEIEPMFEAYLQTLGPKLDALEPARAEDVTLENIQARIRGNILMAISNRSGALVLTTGNKSELAVGYCTLYGDMAGGLAVISDVPKTMVYRIATWLNTTRKTIVEASITKPPSAELRPDQKDEDSLPAYSVLDPILELCIEGGLNADEITSRGFDAEVVRRVLKLVKTAEYKREQAAPGLIVTRKAFGVGRRVPIAQQYQ